MSYSHQNPGIYYDGLQAAQAFYSYMANNPKLMGNQQERYRRMTLVARVLKDHLAINEDGSASIPLETIIETARQEGISQGLSANNLKIDMRNILRKSRYHYVIEIDTENQQVHIKPRK